MKIAILSSSESHPVRAWLNRWAKQNENEHQISIYTHSEELPKKGELLFLISCTEIINKEIRDRFLYSLVIHASDLPKGRGMSPHIWSVLEGAQVIILSMLEAEDELDSGDIWAKREVKLDGTELYDEINEKIFSVEIDLMNHALSVWDNPRAIAQSVDIDTSYYRMRTPKDSRIDPDRTLAEQFDLLRVCDWERFPAFFDFRGSRYQVKLEKCEDEENYD